MAYFQRTDFADIVIQNYLNIVGHRKAGDTDEYIMRHRFVDKIDDWSFSVTDKDADERFITRPYIDHIKALEIMVEKKTHDATKILSYMGMASSGGCLYRIHDQDLVKEFDIDLDEGAVREAKPKLDYEKKRLTWTDSCGGVWEFPDNVDEAAIKLEKLIDEVEQ